MRFSQHPINQQLAFHASHRITEETSHIEGRSERNTKKPPGNFGGQFHNRSVPAARGNYLISAASTALKYL